MLSAVTAALIAATLAWLGPPGSDLAAHAYQRTLFLEHGFSLWNNFWYAGRYSFVSYSVLYYPLAAWFGIRLLAVATISLAALAFTAVLWREWGPTARWSSRSFAVVWAGIVLSAAFPFALGFALALLAIWALQAGRRWRFALLATLSLAASPVAFLLLVVVLAGVALARHASLPANWVPFAAIGVAGTAELVLWRLFPGGGTYPFSFAEIAAGVAFCVLGLAFTWRVESARVLRFVFAVYLVASVTSYLVPSAVGENVERLRYAAIPLAVLVGLAAALEAAGPRSRGDRARRLVEPQPARGELCERPADVTAHEVGVAGRDRVPARAPGPYYRVESVDTTGHWGAPSTSPTPASRSRAAGSGRTTSPRTRCSTASSARTRTSPGCAGSASATSCSRARRPTTAHAPRPR